MKFLYALVACVLLMSCSDSGSDSESQNLLNEETLLGTWVIKMIDGEEVSTNEYFVCRFNDSKVQDYFAVVVDGESSTLSYTEDATFSVEDEIIYISSNSVDLEFDGSITSGSLCGESGMILTYTEIKNIQDGEDYDNDRSFTAINCDADYSDSVIGIWVGKVIADGDVTEPFDDIRIEFKAGDKYDFYCKSDDGFSWVQLEQDNTYYTLGNLVGTQWDESDTVTAAELWLTEIDGDNMTWRAIRTGDNGEELVTGFDFVKESE